MKETTIKTLSGACIMMVCFTPTVQEASEFNFVEDNNTKIEDVVEGATFTFTHHEGSIGIKTQNNR